MAGGLFKSIYAKDGIYNELYSKHGASPPTQRTDIRLGGYFGQAEDEDEDEDEAPKAAPRPKKDPLFSKEYKGLPTWLIGVFLLGFAYAIRRKKKLKEGG